MKRTRVRWAGRVILSVGPAKSMTRHGIHNAYSESPATEREWLAWRRCLNGFAPRLFK